MEDSEKIKKGKNVLRIKLKGKKYNESSFDLMKIPIEWLYQEALCEIGEQESYIEELKTDILSLQEENEKLKRGYTKSENRELRLEIKREKLYQVQQRELRKYRQQRDELRNRIYDLITLVTKYQSEISELKNRLGETDK